MGVLGLTGQQLLDACDELGRHVSTRKPRPLHFAELVRNVLFVVTRLIDDDRDKKRLVGRYEVRTIDCQLPLEPEVTFGPLMGMLRDEGKEQRASLNLLADGLVPGVPTPQLGPIEPDLDPGSSERIANTPGSLPISGSVGKEHGPRWSVFVLDRRFPHRAFQATGLTRLVSLVDSAQA
jgi:hypothetical protein